MAFFLRGIRTCCLVGIAVILIGCAAVPKEVVELSYTVGQDMEAVHLSYQTLIQTHFQGLRTQTEAFLETRWIPVFLSDFIQRGELVEKVQGSDPEIVARDVHEWVQVAVETIEAKKKELLDPIDAQEKTLLKLVDEAFARLTRANATITAHLNSLRKVQEVQDEALKALDLKELRDQINAGLISSSKMAEKALDNLEKAGDLLDTTE